MTLPDAFRWLDANSEALFDCLEAWVACNSVFPDELRFQRDHAEPFLREQLALEAVARVNACAEADRPFVVGVWPGTGGGRNLLLNGHVDTVGAPGSMRAHWSSDPWRPYVRDGKLYGRGSSDMKAGLAAMVWAVKALQAAGVRLRGDVLLALVPGEETMRYDIGTVPAARWFTDQGYTIPFAIVTEPTHLEVHVRSPGQLDFTIEITGKEIHTSMRNLALYPQREGIPQGSAVGVDAIAKLARVLLLLEDLERQWAMRWRHPLHGGGGFPQHEDYQGLGGFSINRTFVEGGTYEGSLPGYARVDGIISYPSFVPAAEVQAEFERVLRAHSELDDWLRQHPPRVRLGARYQWPPLAGPHDGPGPQALGRAYSQATGRPAIFTGSKFVGDASFLQRDCGIPAVYFGPGDCSMGVHGPDEHVPLAQVLDCARTLAAMLVEWCG